MGATQPTSRDAQRSRLIDIDDAFEGEATGIRPKATATMSPTAAAVAPQPKEMNPWIAAGLGSVVTAVAMALVWTVAAPSAPAAAASESAESSAFDQETANGVVGLAAQRARCLDRGTHVALTFSPDGTVRSVDARRTGGLADTAGTCIDQHFADLRIPAFSGDVRRVDIDL